MNATDLAAEREIAEPRRELPAGATGRVQALLSSGAELLKLRVTLLVLLVTAVGYFLGATTGASPSVLVFCLVGTALLAGGASALNQVFERRLDAVMARTERRPIPSGRVRPGAAAAIGSLLGLAGTVVLALTCGALTAVIGVVTFFSYVFVYTPMKRRTPFSVFLGAVPGALPPMIGWAAAGGSLTTDAWIVFAILFVWQIPHFAAIDWLHRDDYLAAGFRTLAASDEDGSVTARQIVWSIILLAFVSVLPSLSGLSGSIYLLGALALGVAFLACGLIHARSRTKASARVVLHASLVYLPVLFLLIIGDKT